MRTLRDFLNGGPEWLPAAFFTLALYVLGVAAGIVTGIVTGDWAWLLCILAAGVAAVLLIGAVVLFCEWLLEID